VSALSRKLRRDLWRIRAQVVSIAGVMAGGVMAVVALRGTSSALERSTAEYYATARFADVFASLTRAPDAVGARLAAIPGVASVQTRVVTDVRLDIPGLDLPAIGRLVSLPPAGAGQSPLNVVRVLRGRPALPGADDEVLVSERFAQANRKRPGDTLLAVFNERRTTLRVVGVGAAPDFLYEEAGNSFPSDARGFAILWAPHELTAAAKMMPTAIATFPQSAWELSPGMRRISM
jgi:putative ABC transport system permease protein